MTALREPTPTRVPRLPVLTASPASMGSRPVRPESLSAALALVDTSRAPKASPHARHVPQVFTSSRRVA